MRIETDDGCTINTHNPDGPTCPTCGADERAGCYCPPQPKKPAPRCAAELPWTRRACLNDATGPDGCCDECRDELRGLDEWADEYDERAHRAAPAARWSREDYERANGPHAARARFGGAR